MLTTKSCRVWCHLVLWGLIGCALAGSLGPSQANAAADKPLHALQARLIQDGFDPQTINQLYSRPQVAFDTDDVALFFVHSEARLNYNQFLSVQSLRKARSYMNQHHEDLTAAQSTYGVEGEIITAIILVETRLGTYLGSSSIINTLSTMAALDDPLLQETLWQALPDDRRITRKRFDQRTRKKSAWAYAELKAFLTYSAREGMDPATKKGSYAGAMGISQFMPSNILRLARDGNGDGHVDLFDHADAIASVANYLKHHGWRPGISRKKAEKAVYAYNHSKYYVDIILKISDRLKN
jgi:membrane-bound lytic murein transglycosylase B